MSEGLTPERRFSDYLSRVERSISNSCGISAELMIPASHSQKEFILSRGVVNEYGVELRNETYEECRLRLYIESKMPKIDAIIRSVY